MLNKILVSISSFILLIAIGAVFLFASKGGKENFSILQINSHKFEVEIAATPTAWTRGLSGRDGLEENRGMLFIFNDLASRKFWMAGMKFPLDIIWISGDRIVGISENLLPATAANTPIYSSPEPADKVLEINSGLAKKLDIRAGDKVVLK